MKRIEEGRLLVLAAVVIALIALVSTPADASPQDDRDLGWVSLEFDPLTTPLGARNLFVYIEPPALPHVSFSVGVFAADFPDWMDEILSYRNRGADFDSQVRISPGFTVDYFADDERKGWHAGMFNFFWRYRVRRNGMEATFTNHVLLPRLGYRWFPWTSVDVYLDPFAGLMFEYKLGGDNNLDGDVVKPTPIIPFASVHAGFHF